MLKKAMIGALIVGAAQLAVIAPAAATETGDVSWGLAPTEVEPGGQIYAETKAAMGGCGPATPVTSPGFAAPLQWTMGGNWGKAAGYGKAGKTPGKYAATFTCSDGRKTSRTFTIIGTPPTTTPKPPTSTKTPKPSKTTTAKPKPKPQVAVKPVGAPQTGGGAFGPLAWDW
ncbi:hypothetical protein [Amycolatopsis regifaucium]|uniref:Ig-like domain-containing protein n=1 Tax=Amycolatopsis regifaucium TaxID=546365 RepID=A0A154MVW1_9PSEU|nr:hypothetical protein [Amycolatopsis regifaucium]KZB87599.1 hypothetical protein AVL48_23595 [Amycolatopsis regifaucium]OKA08428.1 hypothetical protein ATP06_0214355 [Amycolatopsis regifaucium]SFI10341.1 hypothetical protein SAMN04489731_108192 [Amycolatopsis regifaucium]